MSGSPEREAAAKARSKIRRELDDKEVVSTSPRKGKKCTDNNIGPTCFKGKGFRLRDSKEFSRLAPSKSNTPQHSSDSDGDIITTLLLWQKEELGENKIPCERDSSML